MSSQKKLLDLVVKICKEYPAAASNEPILLEQVWLAQGWRQDRSLYDNLSRVSRPESITRRRREAHEAGLIQYSDEIMKERTDAFISERDSHSGYAAISWLKD